MFFPEDSEDQWRPFTREPSAVFWFDYVCARDVAEDPEDSEEF